MSLDFSLNVTKHTSYDGCKTFSIEEDYEVFGTNITHNLTEMADACGLYMPLWRHEECKYTKASDLIEPLRVGIKYITENKESLEKYNPPNGWGSYSCFHETCCNILRACEEYPNSSIEVWR